MKWYPLLIFFVSGLLALFVNIFYTNYVQHETEQKFCGVMRIFDTPQTPPTTPRGVEVQRKMHRLREDLKC